MQKLLKAPLFFVLYLISGFALGACIGFSFFGFITLFSYIFGIEFDAYFLFKASVCMFGCLCAVFGSCCMFPDLKL